MRQNLEKISFLNMEKIPNCRKKDLFLKYYLFVFYTVQIKQILRGEFFYPNNFFGIIRGMRSIFETSPSILITDNKLRI